GTTFISNAIIGNPNMPVFIRARLMTRNLQNAVVPMEDPQLYGLSKEVGGLVKFNGPTDYLVANYAIDASFDNFNWTPYLVFYDNYPTFPGGPPGTSGP